MKQILYFILITACDVLTLKQSDENKICQPDGFDKCSSSKDCCSDYCDKDIRGKFGVCTEACGRSVFAQEYEILPWHAGLYEYNANTYHQICGGTLISSKVVVTAATCFSRFGKIKFSPLKVGLGTNSRIFSVTESPSIQIAEIAAIESPSDYNGRKNFYSENIAFVTLKATVEYTRAVRPICIDVGNVENEQLVKGRIGKVLGWGLTSDKRPGNASVVTDMAFLPRHECRIKLDISRILIVYLTKDKICAGNRSLNETICAESGEGLVFKDPKSKLYYLRGVASLRPVGCKKGEIVLFTKLSFYKDLVEKFVND